MHKLITTVFLLCAVNGFALQSRRITAVAGAPVPSSYSATNKQSLVMSELLRQRHLSIYNGTTDFITCFPNWNGKGTAPTVNTVRASSEEIYLPTLVGATFDDLSIASQIFCKSDTGTNTGNLIVNVW